MSKSKKGSHVDLWSGPRKGKATIKSAPSSKYGGLKNSTDVRSQPK